MAARVLSGAFLRVTLANFLFFLNFAAFFLLPLHVKGLGGSDMTVGAVMGTAGLAALMVLPAIGMAVDRFGRRRFLIAGALTMSLASASFVCVDRIGPALFALRLLQGLSFAAAFTGSTTIAAQLAPRARRAQALGVFGVSTIITHAIAPGIGEEIVHRSGFHALFLTAAVCSALSAALSCTLPQTRPEHLVGAPTEPWRVERLQWILIATMIFAGMGFGAVITFIATFVHDTGLGRVGFFFGAYTSAAILTRLVGAGLSDSFGRRAVVLPTLVGSALSILLLCTVRSLPALALVGALFGAAQGISYPTLHAFLVDLTADAHLGRAQALFNGAFNLGVTGSAFLFGAIADHFGYRTMFAVAAVAPMIAFALLYLYGTDRAAVAVEV
jgi:MFS family permease